MLREIRYFIKILQSNIGFITKFLFIIKNDFAFDQGKAVQ